VVLLSGVAAIIVIEYLALTKLGVEATTEVAGFVVMAAGVLAGAGAIQLASATIGATVLLLVEKRGLHAFVSKVDDVSMRAGARFAVLAVVILPLVPTGPYGPLGGVQPRQLWMIVLFLSGLSFCGFLARRAAGSRGYAIAGLLGGLVSSTSATLSFSNISHRAKDEGRALAAGVLGASVVMFPRILVVSAVLAPAIAPRLWPFFVVPVAIGILLAGQDLRSAPRREMPAHVEDNPLQFGAALKMAVGFQIVLFAVAFAQQRYGADGIYVSAALVGIVEMDAVVLAVVKPLMSGAIPIESAVVAIVIGAVTATLTKMIITLIVGRGSFRPLAAVGLGLIAMALGVALYLR
jgi:uncharacterized membrane protein (DUF4010 family)